MCSVCKMLSKVFDPVQNIIVSRVNNRKNGNPMFIVASEKGGVSFEARYCPWCGEYLHGEKEPKEEEEEEERAEGGENRRNNNETQCYTRDN